MEEYQAKYNFINNPHYLNPNNTNHNNKNKYKKLTQIQKTLFILLPLKIATSIMSMTYEIYHFKHSIHY